MLKLCTYELKLVLFKFSVEFIIHYFNDITLSWPPNQNLNLCLIFMINKLKNIKQISKIHEQSFYSPSGYIITQNQILHYSFHLKLPK